MGRPCLTLLAFLSAFLLVAGASAQESACLHRTLLLNVEDAKGIPIQVLHPADVQAKLREGPIKILSIVPDDRRHRIVILLDASGSMAAKWGRVLAPASALAETKLPNTDLALLIFGSRVYEQVGFSEGQTAIAERLRHLGTDTKDAEKLVRGKTALYDSLLAGLQILGTPTSADILYLVSDGGDNASRAQFGEVSRRLSSSGVRLFVSLVVGDLEEITGVGYRSPTPEESKGPVDMRELVRKTGGEIIVPFTSRLNVKSKEMEQISAALSIFHQSMIQSYRMEVELPVPLTKERNWELKPADQNKERWKGARIVYPQELERCKP
jgi:DNA-binding transcriptional ArsR family regulator